MYRWGYTYVGYNQLSVMQQTICGKKCDVPLPDIALFTKLCLDSLIYIFKSYMKTAKIIVNNLINENIFPLMFSSVRQDG